jgi:drug/metabolite transporter (DMT)-like permease
MQSKPPGSDDARRHGAGVANGINRRITRCRRPSMTGVPKVVNERRARSGLLRLWAERVTPPAALLLVVATACWAGNFVIGRAMHMEIPPVTLTFWRWVVAGAVLLPFAGTSVWRLRAEFRQHWRLLLMLAVTGIVLFHLFVYTGLQSTAATNAALMLATTPVLIPGVSLFLMHEAITLRQGLGIMVSLLGVSVIVLRGDPELIASLRLNPGDLWLLLAVPTWAFYSVLLRRLPASLPRLSVLMAIVAIGVVLLAPLYAVEVAWVGSIAVTAETVFAIAYVALFASVLAYICWNHAVMQVGANKAGLFLHLMPVFATGLAITLLNETVKGYHAAGVACIAIGIFLTTTRRGLRFREGKKGRGRPLPPGTDR